MNGDTASLASINPPPIPVAEAEQDEPEQDEEEDEDNQEQSEDHCRVKNAGDQLYLLSIWPDEVIGIPALFEVAGINWTPSTTGNITVRRFEINEVGFSQNLIFDRKGSFVIELTTEPGNEGHWVITVETQCHRNFLDLWVQ